MPGNTNSSYQQKKSLARNLDPPRSYLLQPSLNIENLPERFRGAKILPAQCIPPISMCGQSCFPQNCVQQCCPQPQQCPQPCSYPCPIPMPPMCPPACSPGSYPYYYPCQPCPPMPCCYPPCPPQCLPQCPPQCLPQCPPCQPPCPPCGPCGPCGPPCPPLPCMPKGGGKIICVPKGQKPGGQNQNSSNSMNGQQSSPIPGFSSNGKEQPASFNNCNFYVSELPKGFNKNNNNNNNNGEMGGAGGGNNGNKNGITSNFGSTSCFGQNGFPEENTDLYVMKNGGAGDDMLIPPPVGYPGSTRKVWGTIDDRGGVQIDSTNRQPPKPARNNAPPPNARNDPPPNARNDNPRPYGGNMRNSYDEPGPSRNIARNNYDDPGIRDVPSNRNLYDGAVGNAPFGSRGGVRDEPPNRPYNEPKNYSSNRNYDPGATNGQGSRTFFNDSGNRAQNEIGGYPSNRTQTNETSPRNISNFPSNRTQAGPAQSSRSPNLQNSNSNRYDPSGPSRLQAANRNQSDYPTQQSYQQYNTSVRNVRDGEDYCIPQDYDQPKTCKPVVWKRKNPCCMPAKAQRLKTLCQKCHDRFAQNMANCGLPMPDPPGKQNPRNSLPKTEANNAIRNNARLIQNEIYTATTQTKAAIARDAANCTNIGISGKTKLTSSKVPTETSECPGTGSSGSTMSFTPSTGGTDNIECAPSAVTYCHPESMEKLFSAKQMFECNSSTIAVPGPSDQIRRQLGAQHSQSAPNMCRSQQGNVIEVNTPNQQGNSNAPYMCRDEQGKIRMIHANGCQSETTMTRQYPEGAGPVFEVGTTIIQGPNQEHARTKHQVPVPRQQQQQQRCQMEPLSQKSRIQRIIIQKNPKDHTQHITVIKDRGNKCNPQPQPQPPILQTKVNVAQNPNLREAANPPGNFQISHDFNVFNVHESRPNLPNTRKLSLSPGPPQMPHLTRPTDNTNPLRNQKVIGNCNPEDMNEINEILKLIQNVGKKSQNECCTVDTKKNGGDGHNTTKHIRVVLPDHNNLCGTSGPPTQYYNDQYREMTPPPPQYCNEQYSGNSQQQQPTRYCPDQYLAADQQPTQYYNDQYPGTSQQPSKYCQDQFAGNYRKSSQYSQEEYPGENIPRSEFLQNSCQESEEPSFRQFQRASPFSQQGQQQKSSAVTSKNQQRNYQSNSTDDPRNLFSSRKKSENFRELGNGMTANERNYSPIPKERNSIEIVPQTDFNVYDNPFHCLGRKEITNFGHRNKYDFPISTGETTRHAVTSAEKHSECKTKPQETLTINSYDKEDQDPFFKVSSTHLSRANKPFQQTEYDNVIQNYQARVSYPKENEIKISQPKSNNDIQESSNRNQGNRNDNNADNRRLNDENNSFKQTPPPPANNTYRPNSVNNRKDDGEEDGNKKGCAVPRCVALKNCKSPRMITCKGQRPIFSLFPPSCPIRETNASILRKQPHVHCSTHNQDATPFADVCMARMPHHDEAFNHKLQFVDHCAAGNDGSRIENEIPVQYQKKAQLVLKKGVKRRLHA